MFAAAEKVHRGEELRGSARSEVERIRRGVDEAREVRSELERDDPAAEEEEEGHDENRSKADLAKICLTLILTRLERKS